MNVDDGRIMCSWRSCLFSYIMAKTSHIRWDDIRFVLDQHA